MVVTCEHCGARYRLDPSRIEGRGARITCPRCRHVFVVYQNSEDGEVATEAVAEERPTDVHALDFKSVGISTWKVKTGIGLVYDFSDYKTLRKYLKEGRVSTSDSLSHDGDSWTPIGDITDLEAHFIDVFVAARAGIKATAKAEVQEEAAEMDAVDAGALADDLLERMSTSEVESDSPTPVAPPDEDASADDIANQLLAAVEAAGSEDGGGDGGIDLDMDALLEQASASVDEDQAPAGARRGAEQKAVQSVAKTGNDDHNPHQFVDPFESLKASRQQRNTTRGRRKSKKAAAKEAEESAKQRKQLILVGLLACAVGVYFYIDRAPPPGPTPQQQEAERAKAAKAAQEEALKQRADEARARMKENLNKALKDVKVEEIDAFAVEEDQLIAKIPEEFRNGGKGMKAPIRPPPGFDTPPGFDGVGGSDVTQRGMSAADHFEMGRGAVRSKNWSDAVRAFKSATDLEPSNAAYRAQYGFALFKSGDLGEAEAQLRQAKSAGAVAASKYLGHLARDQGDISGASNHYQDYLRSGPADAKAIEIIMKQMAE